MFARGLPNAPGFVPGKPGNNGNGKGTKIQIYIFADYLVPGRKSLTFSTETMKKIFTLHAWMHKATH